MTHTPVTPAGSEGAESLTQTTVRSTRVYHTADEGYAAFDTRPSITLGRLLEDLDNLSRRIPNVDYTPCDDYDYGWEAAIDAVNAYMRAMFEIPDPD